MEILILRSRAFALQYHTLIEKRKQHLCYALNKDRYMYIYCDDFYRRTECRDLGSSFIVVKKKRKGEKGTGEEA